MRLRDLMVRTLLQGAVRQGSGAVSLQRERTKNPDLGRASIRPWFSRVK